VDDPDAISRQTQCAMTEFELKSMNAPADPQWQGKSITAKMTTLVTVHPVGRIGAWHENPKPQWIVPLSGRWFVEAMDGTRVEIDQNCCEVDNRRGHRSGTIGDVPAVLMVIQLEEASAPRPPCEFR